MSLLFRRADFDSLCGPRREGPAKSQADGLELGVKSGLETGILELTPQNHRREQSHGENSDIKL